MRLKLNQVYKVGSKMIFISGKRRYKKRVIYKIRPVAANGALGPESERMFKRNECKLVKGCKVTVYVELPKKLKDHARFDDLVNRARKLIKAKSEGYQTEVAKLAICCANFQHPTEARACNLRDFARLVKFKSFNTLYRWVLAYYKLHYTEDKFKKAIPDSADSTIIKMVKHHQDTFKSFYGFNKKLDRLLAMNAKAYLKEFNLRGLSID